LTTEQPEIGRCDRLIGAMMPSSSNFPILFSCSKIVLRMTLLTPPALTWLSTAVAKATPAAHA